MNSLEQARVQHELWKRDTEITTLREQVETLRKERDIKEHCIVQLEAEDLRAKEQLAALAEQNEKKNDALLYVMRATCLSADDNPDSPIGMLYKRASNAYELPDLASPVLNRIRAEGMRIAADCCIKNPLASAHSLAEMLRARADELEKTNG